MAPIETDASAPEASTSAKTPVAGSALPASAARHASPPADSKDATLSAALSAFAAAAEAFKHELHLFGHAGKYEWMNRRLILLRNAVIAFGVVITAMVIVVMLFREAYRETLSIAAFSVPEKLAERGITGQVVAQSLFDELIKRRTTVTTLDAGELKGAWSEHRSDIAVPDTKFTLQSIFRYLRALTGKEIAVDGEMLIDGDEVTIKARVQGKPPRVVKGKLVEWEVLMGQLANYVYEVTQPVVLASYWGLTAKSDAEMEMLSALIRRMVGGEPRATPAVLSVAYYAYGLALERQEKHAEALFAWERAPL